MSNTLEQTLAAISRTPTANVQEAVQARWNSLTKPRGSLGRLEEVIAALARIQDTATPCLERRCMYVFCGDHRITEEGISPYPSVVTKEMMKNFVAGGAAINVLCRQHSIETFIVDAGVIGPRLDGTLDRRIADGAANFLHGNAMSRQQAIAAIESGIELAREAATRFDIAGIGEMGIGNTTSASALVCAFTCIRSEDAVGSGAGLDNDGVRHKVQVISSALDFHKVDASDPLAVVSAFAGFEIATMAGFLLGAAAANLAVVVDGFIGGAAALIARAFYPDIGSHIFFGHKSAERGHAHLLTTVGAAPLLDLGMRLGEGTGAALAIGLITSALHLYNEMATFAEASVSDKTDQGAPTK